MDGDGYIYITKTIKGYIEISLVIGLDVRDSELLKTLQDTLGLGSDFASKSIRQELQAL